MSDDALLQIDGLCAGYGRGTVLHELDLTIREHSTVAIVGPNGAGKTTLMRCISGSLTPSMGTIAFAGQHIERMRANEIARRGISLVPQGRHLFGPLSINENLRLGGHSVRGKTNLDDRIAQLAETFPIVRERGEVLAQTLSGGQQQMVAIARGLVPDPRLLLLDEPSVGLAPTVIDDVAELMTTLRAAGRTVLLSEQNVPLAMSLADEVYVLAQGAVIAHGTPDEVSNMAEVRRAYLGRPAPEGTVS
jgi:branched-chain amino acid transport system ATP-binding protein